MGCCKWTSGFVWDPGGGRNHPNFLDNIIISSLKTIRTSSTRIWNLTNLRNVECYKIGMLRKLETVINEEVIDAISKMDQTTEKLIIPVNTCCRLPGVYNVEQWHLLVFDIIRFKWKNYNSCKDGKIIEKCLQDCDKIAKICETPLNNWFAKHQRGVQLHNAGVGVEYVAQQGRHADCLLFMCDSMKRSCKRFNAPEYGNLKMQLRMQRKRVRLAYKLLTASYPESSWSKFTTLEYLMQFAFE